MGIVNVTPDSFSDGGEWLEPDRAIARGRRLAAEGAHIIDVGGESTRPGSGRTPVTDELDRVLPVVEALAGDGLWVSVDTMRAEVARRSIDAGAKMINDVSGGLADEEMLPTVARAGAAYVAMHWRAHSSDMYAAARYADVVTDVRDELGARAGAARAAGIAADNLVLDPGIGFAKTAAHNWQLLRRLDAMAELGYPLLIGVSRKGFLGSLLGDEHGVRPPKQRDAATAAVTALLAERGVWGVRTHTVRDQLDAIAVASRLAAGR